MSFKPIKCEKCHSKDFLRQVAFSDDGKKIEEWYSDHFIVCKKCGQPLHRNKYLVKHHKRIKIAVLTQQVEDFLKDEGRKDKFKHCDPHLSKLKGKKKAKRRFLFFKK